MPPVTVHIAKTTLSELIARALAGEEIIIARGREPVARLVAIDTPRVKRKSGALRGRVKVSRKFLRAAPAG